MKPLKQKSVLRFFARYFDLKKKYFASTIQDLFSVLQQKKLFKFPSSED
jgi:isopenicillin N synthase-like dioxygenase